MRNLLLRLTVVLLALTCITGAGAAPQPEDPIIGQWVWHNDRLVTFKDDGTCESDKGDKGTWQFQNNSEVQRKYRLNWGRGLAITKFILAEDKKTGQVVTDKNERFTCRRAVD